MSQNKTTVLLSKESQDEIEKWSKSFWIETLVRDLHKHGYSVQNEMDQNATHFMRQINAVSERNGIVLSRIGSLADAALRYEQRLNMKH